MVGMKAMDPDDRELARRLFARATAVLEDAIPASTAGQSPRLSHARAVACARRLRAGAGTIVALAEAVVAIAPPPAGGRKPGRSHS